MPTAVKERRTRSRRISPREYSCAPVALRTPAPSPRALLLAAAIPILFLHVDYQPGVAIGFGSTTINAYLSDFAVLAVVLAALATGARSGFGPLRTGLAIWIAGALFCLWVLVEVALGRHHA